MKVKGFWHIHMVNHWFSIVMDQLRIVVVSGLYDACEEISIGCIGSPADKDYLERLVIAEYPKFKIKYSSTRAEDYEFPTLHLIEEDKESFVGFYFHTKAVTRPFDVMQNYWRAHMNEMVLNRWEENYQQILAGNDVSSINYLRNPDHFSGNFWWFNRSYIDKLPKIEALNPTYRWDAEQWICRSSGKYYYPSYFDHSKDTFKILHK